MSAGTPAGLPRSLSRAIALTGIATAGAVAVSLPFAPSAAAEGVTGHGVLPTAEPTAAPAAFVPHGSAEHVVGKALVTEDDEENPEEAEETAEEPADESADENADDSADENADENAEDAEEAEDEGEDAEAEEAEAEEAEAEEAEAEDAEAEEEAEPEPEAEPTKGRGAEYSADGTLIPVPHHEQPGPEPAPAEDIERWINEALEVMDEHGIPGSYEGIHRNLIRESSGDPLTINLWDSNAHKNIPSKGLLQVIDPTFEQYHVEGTSTDIYDPVANIVAACNYAAARYGSMDNVNSAY